jgi:hypothetical protein
VTDDVARDCVCGHSEHHGPCRRTHTVHYMPHDAPDGATPNRWNSGRTYLVETPCPCASFREYEGELP